MEVLDIDALRGKAAHSLLGNGTGLVGRVVQYLDFQESGRVLDGTHRLDQAIGDIHLVVKRKLDCDVRHRAQNRAWLWLPVAVRHILVHQVVAVPTVDGEEAQDEEMRRYRQGFSRCHDDTGPAQCGSAACHAKMPIGPPALYGSVRSGPRTAGAQQRACGPLLSSLLTTARSEQSLTPRPAATWNQTFAVGHVVVGQLLARPNIPRSPDPDGVPHDMHVAVWSARVVDEPRQITVDGRVTNPAAIEDEAPDPAILDVPALALEALLVRDLFTGVIDNTSVLGDGGVGEDSRPVDLRATAPKHKMRTARPVRGRPRVRWCTIMPARGNCGCRGLFVAIMLGLFVVGMVRPASAQGQGFHVEVTPFVGTRFGATFEIRQERAPQAQAFLEEALSSGISAGIRFDGLSLVELRWTRAESTLQSGVGVGPLGVSLANIRLDEFHGDFTREFPVKDFTRVRPFLTASVGATHLGDGNSSFTRLSFGLGTGLKLFLNSMLGVRLQAQWLPIWVEPEVGAFACGGSGCLVVLSGRSTEQFELNIGPVLSF